MTIEHTGSFLEDFIFDKKEINCISLMVHFLYLFVGLVLRGKIVAMSLEVAQRIANKPPPAKPAVGEEAEAPSFQLQICGALSFGCGTLVAA